jgi:hypothetical protein
MPRRLTSTWPDVGFFKPNREPADVDRVPVAREVAEDRGPVRVPGRPASGSRRERRWSVCGSVWQNLVGKIRQLRCSSRCQALQAYLHQVTLRVIREEVYADASEAQEVSEALPPN